MASAWYNKGKASVMNHGIDLLADTIKVMLLGPGYVFNADHHFVSDIVASEVSGAGYVGGFNGAGRLALTTRTITEDDTADAAFFTADPPAWATLSVGTVAWAVIFKQITNDASSPLVAAIDVNPDFVTSSSNLQINWNALGILKLA